VYRARDRRSHARVALKAYPRVQRGPARAAALDREREMLSVAGGHPGVVALERVLEVGAVGGARGCMHVAAAGSPPHTLLHCMYSDTVWPNNEVWHSHRLLHRRKTTAPTWSSRRAAAAP
jgi:hypothetical protein